MTPDKIKKLLSLGEGQRLEFKSSTHSLDALGQVVCGFLNASGGYLICGVNDKGDVTGIDASPDAVKQIEQFFMEKISPKAYVAVQVEQLEKKPVIVIEVPAGKDVPYAFKDVIYIRSAEKTEKADAETIRDIVMRHQIEPERWERRFSFRGNREGSRRSGGPGCGGGCRKGEAGIFSRCYATGHGVGGLFRCKVRTPDKCRRRAFHNKSCHAFPPGSHPGHALQLGQSGRHLQRHEVF